MANKLPIVIGSTTGVVFEQLQSGDLLVTPSAAATYTFATAAFGTDERVLRSDGTTFGVQASPFALTDAGIGSGVVSFEGGMVFNDAAGDFDFRVEGDTLTHAFFIDASAATENIALVATGAPNWQSMDRGLFIGNASTAPTGNPTDGVFMYASAGELFLRDANGGIRNISTVGLIQTATKTGNYTAVAQDLVPCDISGGSFTVTLPTSPVVDDEVGIFVLSDTVPNIVTISNTGGGSPDILGKMGSYGTSLVLYIENDYVRLKYLGSSVWLVVDDEVTLHNAEMRGDATTGQTIPHNTTTVLDFATEVLDNAGLADTSTDEVTIRRAGRYMVSVSAGLASAGLIQQMSINIRRNGTNIRGTQQLPAAFASNLIVNNAALITFAAGDVITVSVVQQTSDTSSKDILLTEAATSRVAVQEVR